MSGFKGTPGPWESKDWRVVNDYRNRPIHVICDTASNKVSRTEENKANAKLIAAAPELLEALIDAHRSLAHFVDSAVIPDTTVMQAYAQAKLAEAKARAALAKAT
jgi:hypothetical protein